MASIKRVAVALSGGVDSAVSALLLKRKGFDVFGVFMKNWDLIDEKDGCTSMDDEEDVKFICSTIGIPFKEVSFVKEYWNDVFTYFVESYENGLNPNPDIMCNKKIKFDKFYRYVTETLGADAMATGHYARSSFGCYLEKYNPSKSVSLLKAVDSVKDQTFFLSQIPQESLRKTMFPVGELIKETVRCIAVDNGLGRIAKKRESMGPCFIGRRNFRRFICDYIVPRPGKVIDVSTGKVEGSHQGFQFWIVGQRFHMPGINKPRYVTHKGLDSEIFVGAGANHPALLSNMILTAKPHWVRTQPDLDMFFDCEFLFQKSKKLVKCRLFSLKSGELFVLLKKPLRMINRGQFAVFYKGDECLGSAEITKVGPTYFSLGKSVPNGFREYDDEAQNVQFIS